jgi:hypothetical protein
MNVSTSIREVRTVLENRRAERLARRRLSEELAAYQTPAERAELDQMIGRYSADQTREIREILNRQDHERLRTASGIGGHRAA